MKRIIILIIVAIIFSSISYAYVYDSLNGLDLNDDLNDRLGITVYGDYGDVPDNDFAFVPNGFYLYKSIEGEFRYHGFDINFNPYTNINFPNDADSFVKLSNKNWIKQGWETAGFSNDDYFTYLRFTEDSPVTFFLKEAYRHMLPFQIYSLEDMEQYLYIKEFPTITNTGEGIMWHRTENGVWYQTFSLNKMEDKLQTDVELSLNEEVVNEYDFQKNCQTINLELFSELKDDVLYKDKILRSLYYHRDDIDYFVYEINGERFEINPNEDFNESCLDYEMILDANDIKVGYKDLSASVYIVYMNGKKSATKIFEKRITLGEDAKIFSYFNTSNIVLTDEVNIEDIQYFDLSKGAIDSYEISLSSENEAKTYLMEAPIDNEKVEEYILDFIMQYDVLPYVPIVITQRVEGFLGESIYSQTIMMVYADTGIDMAFDIPDRVFDRVRIPAVNETDMKNVGDKKLYVNHQSVNFNYFFSGQYVYGDIDKDKLIPVDIELTSVDGLTYQYHTWIVVQTTKPRINIKQINRGKEGVEIAFENDEANANSLELLNQYPIEYTIQTKDQYEIVWEGKAFHTTIGQSGVYDMRIIADNGIQRTVKDYNIVVHEDLKPVINLNLYDNQIYRGETLHFSLDTYSPDGDAIVKRSVIVYEDLDGNGIYENNFIYSDKHVFIDLGNYCIVVETFEAERSSNIRRDFIVDNHMPLTTLSLEEKHSPEEVDILFVVKGEYSEEEKAEIMNQDETYEDILLQRGYDPTINYHFDGVIQTDRNISVSIETGKEYPSETYFYTEEGYEGILTLDSVENFGAYQEEGGYISEKTCRDVPVYEQIRSCSICGTYINALGFRMCKFCYVVTGTTEKCTTKNYWVSDIVWVDDYIGYYSGTVTKNDYEEYVDCFRPKARKITLIVDGDESDLVNWEGTAEEVYLYTENTIDEILMPNEEYPSTFLVDEQFTLLSGEFDFENDPIINSAYCVHHDIEYFDNIQGFYEFNDIWRNDSLLSFAMPGIYEIKKKTFDLVTPEYFSKQSNEPSVYLKIHRRPIAKFVLIQSNPLQIIDYSYDLDYQFRREDKGIVEKKLIITDDSGNKMYSLPESLPEGEYLFEYYVLDCDGAWGNSSQTIDIVEIKTSVSANVNPETAAIGDIVTLEDIELFGRGFYDINVSVLDYKGESTNLFSKSHSIFSRGYHLKDIDFKIPDDYHDGTCYFRVSLKDTYNSKVEEAFFPFIVDSPINLNVIPLGKVKVDDFVKIVAETESYVEDVSLIDGNQRFSMKRKGGQWEIEYQIKEDSNLKVEAVLNDIVEIKPVIYELEDLIEAQLTIQGQWNYWRGQMNILGEVVEFNPNRFMALEKVTIELKVQDLAEDVILRFDPRFAEEDHAMNYNGGCYSYDWIVPMVTSSLNRMGIRVKDQFFIDACFNDQQVRVYFDITGNIYDRIYIEPEH